MHIYLFNIWYFLTSPPLRLWSCSLVNLFAGITVCGLWNAQFDVVCLSLQMSLSEGFD